MEELKTFPASDLPAALGLQVGFRPREIRRDAGLDELEARATRRPKPSCWW